MQTTAPPRTDFPPRTPREVRRRHLAEACDWFEAFAAERQRQLQNQILATLAQVDHSEVGGQLCHDDGTGCCTGCGVILERCDACAGVGYHFASCDLAEQP